jgi:hypothetical protein
MFHTIGVAATCEGEDVAETVSKENAGIGGKHFTVVNKGIGANNILKFPCTVSLRKDVDDLTQEAAARSDNYGVSHSWFLKEV